MLRYLRVLLIAALPACSPANPRPTTYDECILQHLQAGQTEVAARAIISSCIQSFKPTFDWEAMARKVGKKPWSAVAQDSMYIMLSIDEKIAAKKDYWIDVLLPQTRAEFKNVAELEFMAFTP